MDDIQDMPNMDALESAIKDLNEKKSDVQQIDLYATNNPESSQMVHETAEDLEQKRKAKSNRFQKRISQMTHEINYERQARQKAEARAREAELRAEENSRIAHLNYQYLLKQKKEQIKERLKIAEEEGDTDVKTELIDQLSNINADLKDFENQNYANRERDSYSRNYEQPQYSQKDYQESELDIQMEEFLGDHEWMDERSSNYDPDMYEEAQLAAAEIAKYLRANGAASKIGSIEFYEQVAKVVEDQYRLDGYADSHNYSHQTNNYDSQWPGRSSPPTTPISKNSYSSNQNMNYRNDSNYKPIPNETDQEQARRLVGIMKKDNGEFYTEKELAYMRAMVREKQERMRG